MQQFSGNIASQLTQRGLPGPLGATIASRIASAGAQASQVPLPGRLPLPPSALHQAINQAFVDTLHGSFLIAGITMLVTAVLVAFLLRQRAPGMSGKTAEADKLSEADAQPQETAAGPNRSRALLG